MEWAYCQGPFARILSIAQVALQPALVGFEGGATDIRSVSASQALPGGHACRGLFRPGGLGGLVNLVQQLRRSLVNVA